MSAVGIVTIALGVLGVCEGGGALVAPEAFFGWHKETIASNARIRMLGAFVMALGGGDSLGKHLRGQCIGDLPDDIRLGAPRDQRAADGAVPRCLPRYRQPVHAVRHKQLFLVALRRAGKRPRRGVHNLFRRACALTHRTLANHVRERSGDSNVQKYQDSLQLRPSRDRRRDSRGVTIVRSKAQLLQ